MLACSAVTKKDVRNLVNVNQNNSKIFVPDKAKAKIYKSYFEKYKKLYQSLKKFW